MRTAPDKPATTLLAEGWELAVLTKSRSRDASARQELRGPARLTVWTSTYSIFKFFCCGLMTIQMLVPATNLYSQTGTTLPPADSAESQSDTKGLTEDLLDLLMKPPKADQVATPVAPEKSAAPVETDLVEQDRVDSGDTPLHSVRQQMFAAAGMLHNGKTGEPTRQIQTDIVKQLDELIEQLGRSSQNSSKSSDSQSSQSARQKSEQTRQQPTSSKQRSSTQTAGADHGKQVPDTEGQTPGDKNAGGPDSGELKNTVARNADVQLADPRAMQQKVWGQLPDRVRQQMQSRMVEQFLPSFREQINAYYRELAK